MHFKTLPLFAGGKKALRGHHFLPWSWWIHWSWWWATTPHHVGAARRVLAKRTPEALVTIQGATVDYLFSAMVKS
jgi:hypothetical protein